MKLHVSQDLVTWELKLVYIEFGSFTPYIKKKKKKNLPKPIPFLTSNILQSQRPDPGWVGNSTGRVC